MRARKRHSKNRAATIAGSLSTAALGLIALMQPGAALAQQDFYRAPNFDPQVSVSLSDTRAGASPEIAFRVHKSPSHCAGQPIDYSPIGPAERRLVECVPDEVHLTQDLRTATIDLPPGALADVNALPPPCDLRDVPLGDYDLNDLADKEGGDRCGPANQVGVVLSQYPYQCRFFTSSVEYSCEWAPLGVIRVYPVAGTVYNGYPEAGEQARFHIILGACTSSRPEQNFPSACDPRAFEPSSSERVEGLARVDLGIRLVTSATESWHLQATTSTIPQAICLEPYEPDPTIGEGCRGQEFGGDPGDSSWIYYPVDDFTTILFAQPTETGGPLGRNPTSCRDKEITGVFTGYVQNVYFDDALRAWIPDFSNAPGITAQSSAPYLVTACNSLPYDPGLQITADPPTPASASAITSVVTQAEGEQTTKEIRVELPESFKVNVGNTLAQCTKAEADTGSCPAASQIGAVTAESNLLPKTGEDAGPLQGEVYVGETTAENIKVYTVLHGFVDAVVEGRLEIDADGSSQAIFTLPEVPQQKITLSLFGGKDKALVTTPKTCGTHTLKAAFTSHQGKEIRKDVPIQVACDQASLDIDLGTRRARAHPTVSMTASAAGMSGLSFRLPAGMKVRSRPATGKGYGTLDLVTQGGTTSTELELLRRSKKRRSLLFSAVQDDQQVTSLVLRHRRRNEIAVTGLPEGTTSATLELVGKKDNLLANPESCLRRTRDAKGRRHARGTRSSLSFAATVTNVEGTTMRPTLRMSMSCKGSGVGMDAAAGVSNERQFVAAR